MTQCPYCLSTHLVIRDRQQNDQVSHAVQCLECGYRSLTVRSHSCDAGGVLHTHSQSARGPGGASSARASASARTSAKRR
jgi:Zn ribbon nucleic-acid-binding protein